MALESQEHDLEQTIGGRPIGEWLSWARDQVQKHDPAQAGIARTFEGVAAVTSWTYRD